MSDTNYSFQTSLPAYKEEPSTKKRQADELYAFIQKGACCLLQIADLTGLPQSTVSGRVNDLIQDNKVEYKGHVVYKDRKRKKIVAKVVITTPVKQGTLFNE